MNSSSTSIPRIDPQEAQRKVAQGAHLIDVRTYPEFRAGHADGARHVELAEIERQPGTVAEHLFDDSQPLLFLCKAGSRACRAAETATGLADRPIFIVEGGTDAWEQAGLPMQKETSALSLERQVRIGAGALVALGAALALLFSPVWALLPLFVGIGLVNAGVTNWCGMALLMAKMPWNRKQVD